MPSIRRRIQAGHLAMLPGWLGAIFGLVLAVSVTLIVAVMGLIGLGVSLIRRTLLGGRTARPLVQPAVKPAVETIAMRRADDGTWHPGQS